MDDRNFENGIRPNESGNNIEPAPENNSTADSEQQDKDQNQNRNQNYSYGYYQTGGSQNYEPGRNQNYGPGGNQPYHNMYAPNRPVNNNTFALVAMIMGIGSILLACCTGIGGVVLGALGIIFAVISRGRERMCTQAKIGLGISVAGIVLGIIVFVSSLLLISSGEFQRMFEDQMDRYGYEYNYDEYDNYRDDFNEGGDQFKNGMENGLNGI